MGFGLVLTWVLTWFWIGFWRGSWFGFGLVSSGFWHVFWIGFGVSFDLDWFWREGQGLGSVGLGSGV